VSIEQHMRVVVCRLCGALAADCNGTCTHATEKAAHLCPTPHASTGPTDTNNEEITGNQQPNVDTTTNGES
jgi:hypothetical protein